MKIFSKVKGWFVNLLQIRSSLRAKDNKTAENSAQGKYELDESDKFFDSKSVDVNRNPGNYRLPSTDAKEITTKEDKPKSNLSLKAWKKWERWKKKILGENTSGNCIPNSKKSKDLKGQGF